MLGSVVRNLLAVLIGFFGLPCCLDLLLEIIARHRHPPPHPWSLAGGLAAGLLFLLLRRPNRFLQTFLHEMAHGIACLVLWVKIDAFFASRNEGGFVRFEYRDSDPLRSTLIHLAPYVLPLALGPVLVVRLAVPPGPWQAACSALASFCYVLHLAGLVDDLRGNFWGPESDFAKAGRFLGLVLVLGSLILLTAATVYGLWAR